MADTVEMPLYQSHKKVRALKIACVTAGQIHFEDKEQFAPVNTRPGLFARYTPAPGDYYVIYEDGYESISPAKAFEEGYTRV